jgi:hypothetical protein
MLSITNNTQQQTKWKKKQQLGKSAKQKMEIDQRPMMWNNGFGNSSAMSSSMFEPLAYEYSTTPDNRFIAPHFTSAPEFTSAPDSESKTPMRENWNANVQPTQQTVLLNRRKRNRAPSLTIDDLEDASQWSTTARSACQSNGEEAVQRLRGLYSRLLPESTNESRYLSKTQLCSAIAQQLHIDHLEPIEVDAIPSEYLDPETQEPLINPYLVRLPNSTIAVNYNRSTLQGWVQRNQVPASDLATAIQNQRLGAAVRAWLQRHGIVWTDDINTAAALTSPNNNNNINNNSTRINNNNKQPKTIQQLVQQLDLDVGDLVWVIAANPQRQHISRLPTGRTPYVVFNVDPLQLVDSREPPFRTWTITDPNVSLLRTAEAVEECLQLQPQRYSECLDTIDEYLNWLQIQQWQHNYSSKIEQELQDALLQSNKDVRLQMRSPARNYNNINNNRNDNQNYMSSYIS